MQISLANFPVSITTGLKIVEVKSVECNKGRFIRWLIEKEFSDSLVICIGDDRTDEDMFRELSKNGITIKVGSENTLAQYRLFRPTEVQTLLQEMLETKKSFN